MFDDVLPGGGFLVADVPIGKLFSPEDLNETQKEFRDSTRKFIANEVLPKADALEAKEMAGDTPLVVKLVKTSAELGMCSIDIPEEFGGLGMDKTTSALLAEVMGGLVRERQLAGYEVRDRIYEIGSPAGLAELESLLQSKSL